MSEQSTPVQPAPEQPAAQQPAAGQPVPTPGQTVGPFYGYALPYPGGEELVERSHPQALRLHGTVYDGAGDPVPDALLEIWQADADGRIPREPGSLLRDGWTFTGFGRQAVDRAGGFSFTTIAPGPTEQGSAPFIALTVFARGLLNRHFTRIYLPDDPQLLESDPLLRSVPPERRGTLIAQREPDGSLRFDVRLQGEGETVFLRFPQHAV